MLLLLLLLQLPLSLPNAIIAVLILLVSFPLQNLDAKASVYGIVASKVAIREPPADLMTASIGDLLEVAHIEAVCNLVNQHHH